ncbi:MAG: zinc-binding alcohol dehydrogenase family protein [Deltaproteobacteria bacterium]|nr:zinc-binding alcohol dehydrogenase family protein [Deltaproteobacteria bacterium]
MKAVILEKPHYLTYTNIDEAQQPGSGEALVEVHRVGICGTDISGYLGKFPFYSYPRIPGHELGVKVLAVGDDVEDIKPGDKCSVEPYINDPSSFASKRGHSNCCENLQVLGVHTDGGMRERFIVPARKLHVSESLTMDQLALVEMLAIGCHAVDRCCPTKNENVLIIGAGPIGLSVIEFVKLSGAITIVMDMNEERLNFCRTIMGVDNSVTFRGDGKELEELQYLTDGNLPSIVIDATGNSKSMSNALNYVANSGTLLYVGTTNEIISFPNRLLHGKEMNLLASRNALPRDFSRIIGLIEEGTINTDPWITHRTTLEELPHVFDSYTKPETGAIKAVVEIR